MATALADVDRLDRERGEDHGGHAEVPRVLGGVLAAAAVGQPVAPLDALQPVELHEEGERGATSVAARSSSVDCTWCEVTRRVAIVSAA